MSILIRRRSLTGLRAAVVATACAAVALLALAPRASASVIVVDLSGGGEFTSLPAAIAAAVDGDTVLIRPGDYTRQATKLEIIGRGLTIAADGAGPVLVPPILIGNAMFPKRTVLRGLTAHSGPTMSIPPGLYVITSDVLAEDCDFLGHEGGVFTGTVPGQPGVIVLAGSVVLKDCVAQGGKGFDSEPGSHLASSGGPGVDVQFGSASIYGGHLIGGNGGDIFDNPEGVSGGVNFGGPALVVNGNGSFVAGALLSGGNGGNGDELTHPASSYKGGHGIQLTTDTVLTVMGVTIEPGVGGFDGNGVQGAPGQPTQLGAGASIVTQPGPYRDYALGPPTPEGDSLHLSYSGIAGDTLAVFVSTQPGLLPLPAKQGAWHLGSPLFGPFLMTAPTGTLSLNIPIAGVGLGPDGALQLYEQVFVKPASGPALLSSPSTHLIVDGSL